MDERDPDRPGLVFLAALRGALGRTPLWIVCWAVPLCLALVIAVSWKSWLSDALEHRYEPGSALASFDETFRFDHRAEIGALRDGGAQTVGVLALLVMIFGVFSAGGWLQVFLERTAGHSLRRFLWGGSRYFWRFARLWILTILVLSLSAWILYAWPWKNLVMGFLFGAPDGETEVLHSELTAVTLGWVQAGLYAGLFALILVWGDYTRTRLALLDGRSSIWAGLCTLGLLLRHPWRLLRPMLLITGVEGLVLCLAGWLSWRISVGAGDSSWMGIALLLALGQFALIWRAISRGARYHAAVVVSRALVPPLTKPDPWASRVGGPGGPQYPIDTSDDYGVSL
ncbi:MAG: hypothetical protein O7B99_03710 [Planctomycetota bacterium]|nr:hypothetical protein [Planctomycetota bacterium]